MTLEEQILAKTISEFMRTEGIDSYTHINEWLVEANGMLYFWHDEAEEGQKEARTAFVKAYRERLNLQKRLSKATKAAKPTHKI